jgi:hypothetical protein
MPHLSQFPDSPEYPIPIAKQPADGDAVADIPTQKQSARPRSLSKQIDDIIRLDTIKIMARRSQETIARIPTVHIPTISQHIARIPTVHIPAISHHIASITTARIPTISQYLPAVMQRRLSMVRRHDRLLIIIMLIGLLVPVGSIPLECLNSYSLYSYYAQDGIDHLIHVKTIFIESGPQAHSSTFLDMPELQRAQYELRLAQHDFQQLQSLLQRDALLSLVLPQQMASMRTLSTIGIDITEIGQELTLTSLALDPALHGSLIRNTSKLHLTATILAQLRATCTYLLPRLLDIENLSHTLSLDALPISLTQRQQLTRLLSPLMMSHILTITGPMVIPAYHETITDQNLEQRLHYYQLDNTGIHKEELIEHIEDPALARKSFTAALTRTLIDHVRHAPSDELLAITHQLLQELLTNNVQVSATNP